MPEGLEVRVTYDGAEAAPVNAGRYAVSAVVVDDAWEGGAEGVLVASKGRQVIEFAEIGSCGVAERLELEAAASSGLGVTFAVLSGPAILEGGASLRFASATPRWRSPSQLAGCPDWKRIHLPVKRGLPGGRPVVQWAILLASRSTVEQTRNNTIALQQRILLANNVILCSYGTPGQDPFQRNQ